MKQQAYGRVRELVYHGVIDLLHRRTNTCQHRTQRTTSPDRCTHSQVISTYRPGLAFQSSSVLKISAGRRYMVGENQNKQYRLFRRKGANKVRWIMTFRAKSWGFFQDFLPISKNFIRETWLLLKVLFRSEVRFKYLKNKHKTTLSRVFRHFTWMEPSKSYISNYLNEAAAIISRENISELAVSCFILTSRPSLKLGILTFKTHVLVTPGFWLVCLFVFGLTTAVLSPDLLSSHALCCLPQGSAVTHCGCRSSTSLVFLRSQSHSLPSSTSHQVFCKCIVQHGQTAKCTKKEFCSSAAEGVFR